MILPRPIPPSAQHSETPVPATSRPTSGCGCGKKRAAAGLSLVIGIGTGRCGTTSLTRLLAAQRGVAATHEARPIMEWDVRKQNLEEPVVDRICRLAAAAPQDRGIVADVALFYLPYVAAILNHWPETKIVCLRRDRQEMIESFQRKVAESWGKNVNHWTIHREGVRTTEWCKSFPKYDVPADDLASSLAMYWDDYYKTVGELRRTFSRNIRIFETESLNTPHGVSAILDFISIKREDQVIVHPHTNRTRGALQGDSA